MAWRDTALLVDEFRLPLAAFAVLIASGGAAYMVLSDRAGEPVGLVQATYHVLSLTFLQATLPWPGRWYLEAFYFVMPLLGIATLAQGLADFGALLFNRRHRGKEWEMAIASTLSGHVIVVGLGHLGYRVITHLTALRRDAAVIELAPDDALSLAVKDLDVPVIPGDATREATLVAAGIREARAIVLCTQNDGLNLQVALKARALNPKIEVVVRIFDEDFADHLARHSGFKAFSASGMAAPMFAAAAAGIDVTTPLVVDGTPLSLARFRVDEGSPLAGRTVRALEDDADLNVVLISRGAERLAHPDGDTVLRAGDHLAVLGDPARLHRVTAV